MIRLLLPLAIVFMLNPSFSISQNGLHFDGNDDYVQTSYDGVTGTANRTIEAWIKTTYVSSQEVVADYGSMTIGTRFTLNLIGGYLRCEIGGQGQTGSTYIADNAWHHVAVTYDNGASEKFKLYIDGNLEASFNLTSVTMNTNSTTNFRIGSRVDNANRFIGSIDEVRFWNVARTANEISANLYTEFCVPDTNLVAYYKLNEGIAGGSNSGTNSTYDASGNGHSGALQNFSLSGSSSNWVTGYGLGTTVLTSTVSETGCDGSYTSPSGNFTWTSSGTYYDTIQSVMACDSALTITLDFGSSSTNTIQVEACSSYTSPSGFYTYTTSGTFMDTILNAAGCDSVITIDLSIQNSMSTINVEACSAFVLPSGDDTVYFSGTYFDTIPNAAGCDSLMTITLQILGNSNATIFEEACLSYSSPSGNYVWMESGTYFDTIPTAAGCDSILSIVLTVKDVDTDVIQAGYLLSAQAQNATYQWIRCPDGESVQGATTKLYTATSSGSYAVIVTQNGCTDTSDCYDVVVAGLNSISSEAIQIFPNPTRGAWQVRSLDALQSIRVSDVAGRTVFEEVIASKTNALINTSLPPGTYFVKIETDQHGATLPLIVQ